MKSFFRGVTFMKATLEGYWNTNPASLMASLGSSLTGLTVQEAEKRLQSQAEKPTIKIPRDLTLLISQFKSPIVLLLIASSLLSVTLKDFTDATIILVIIFTSGILGFWQERGAENAVNSLLSLVGVTCNVLRDANVLEVPRFRIVPGDIVLLSAGDIIPADGVILDSNHLFVDEAPLTGESFPTSKAAGTVPVETPLSGRTNVLYMGTHVVSGTARMLAIKTGKESVFGSISSRLKLRPPETEFERGIRRFGYLLMEVTLLLVILIFAVNVYLHRPVLEALLFSLALAVGLTPQLLPAVISVNLARGARTMAERKVIVKRLSAIENIGSMNVLCSDKTGTLTEGVVHVDASLDPAGKSAPDVLRLAAMNSWFESGFSNPVDLALKTTQPEGFPQVEKLGEIPYDFARKRLTVLVRENGASLLVTKGALNGIISVCSRVATQNGPVPIADFRETILEVYRISSSKGYRVIGVAYGQNPALETLGPENEKDLVFAGFILLKDPVKETAERAIRDLRDLGVSLKVVTGDNALVASTVAGEVGLDETRILTGEDLRNMTDEALIHAVGNVDVFADVEPNQKERIILAMKKAGNVVGFLGDGINDAPALHSADVGISVDTGVDVAKEAADLVLLQQDLEVLRDGIREGRKTFANTMKYVFMATSANFGNMFSMAWASLFLPFLPLLPKQVLLTNLLTDFPEMAIASDRVDENWLRTPRRWDVGFIKHFMTVFGLLSSVFDFMTFAVLLVVFRAGTDTFRTAWFVESVVSASLIVLVIRTRKLFWKDKPGSLLLMATGIIVTLTVGLPFTPLRSLLGFTSLPIGPILAIILIVALYFTCAETTKRIFYKHVA